MIIPTIDYLFAIVSCHVRHKAVHIYYFCDDAEFEYEYIVFSNFSNFIHELECFVTIVLPSTKVL